MLGSVFVTFNQSKKWTLLLVSTSYNSNDKAGTTTSLLALTSNVKSGVV